MTIKELKKERAIIRRLEVMNDDNLANEVIETNNIQNVLMLTLVYPNDGEIVFSDNSDCIISAEREDYITIVTDLLFAYLNKDSDFPHEFERKAVKNALEFLSAQGNVQYKITDFFDDGDMES